uniref:Zinc finger protein n=1 Tax=Steinernema glaseri TaxID=37863 RepID=A0A1I8A1E1_9BILA
MDSLAFIHRANLAQHAAICEEYSRAGKVTSGLSFSEFADVLRTFGHRASIVSRSSTWHHSNKASTLIMDDMNACASCGYTTKNLSEFTRHIEQHESESHKEGDSPSPNPMIKYELTEGEESSGSSPSSESQTTSTDSGFSMARSDLSISQASPERSAPSAKPEKVMHSCPHCNFTTYMSQHMKSHLEAHERHQGQMFMCDICQMQFSQKANMHRHRMRHTGVKPYQCRYCLKKFFRKDQMQEHSMTHIKTGDDFDCPVTMCDMQFSQHSALRNHLDDHHTISPASPASCKRCALLFSNSRRLLLHYQTKHDDLESIADRSKSEVKSETKSEDGATDLRTTLGDESSGMASPRLRTGPPAKRKRTQANSGDGISESFTSLLSPAPFTTLPQTSVADSNDFENKYLPYNKRMTSEDFLLSISKSATESLFADFMKASESAQSQMQLWTSTNSTDTSQSDEHQSHSPSDHCSSGSSEGDEKEQLECTHCGVIFLDQTMYLLHKGLHSDSDPWKCNLCGYGCGDKYMFTTHMISSNHN